MDIETMLKTVDKMRFNNFHAQGVKYTSLYPDWQKDLDFTFVHGQKVYVGSGKNKHKQIVPFQGRVVECVIYPTFDERHMQFFTNVLSGKVCRNFACIIHNKDLVKSPLFADFDYDSQDIKYFDNFDDLPKYFTCNDCFDVSYRAPPTQDKTRYKKLHMHVVLYFQDERSYTNTAFAKKFYLDSQNVYVFGKLKPRLSYLVHGFNADKATYSCDEVCGTSYMTERLQDGLVLDLLSDKQCFDIVRCNLDTLANNKKFVSWSDCYDVIYSCHMDSFRKRNSSLVDNMIRELVNRDKVSGYQVESLQHKLDNLLGQIDLLHAQNEVLKDELKNERAHNASLIEEVFALKGKNKDSINFKLKN